MLIQSKSERPADCQLPNTPTPSKMKNSRTARSIEILSQRLNMQEKGVWLLWLKKWIIRPSPSTAINIPLHLKFGVGRLYSRHLPRMNHLKKFNFVDPNLVQEDRPFTPIPLLLSVRKRAMRTPVRNKSWTRFSEEKVAFRLLSIPAAYAREQKCYSEDWAFVWNWIGVRVIYLLEDLEHWSAVWYFARLEKVTALLLNVAK